MSATFEQERALIADRQAQLRQWEAFLGDLERVVEGSDLGLGFERQGGAVTLRLCLPDWVSGAGTLAPAPVAAPVAPVVEKAEAPSGAKPRGKLSFTLADDALIVSGRAAGRSVAAIAAELCRPKTSVQSHIYNRLLEQIRLAEKELEAVAPKPAAPPASAVLSAVATLPRNPAVVRHLKGLTAPKGWGPARDIALLQGVLSGRSLGEIALKEGLALPDLRRRRDALCQYDPVIKRDLYSPADVLAVLQGEAAA